MTSPLLAKIRDMIFAPVDVATEILLPEIEAELSELERDAARLDILGRWAKEKNMKIAEILGDCIEAGKSIREAIDVLSSVDDKP